MIRNSTRVSIPNQNCFKNRVTISIKHLCKNGFQLPLKDHLNIEFQSRISFSKWFITLHAESSPMTGACKSSSQILCLRPMQTSRFNCGVLHRSNVFLHNADKDTHISSTATTIRRAHRLNLLLEEAQLSKTHQLSWLSTHLQMTVEVFD